MPSHLFSVADGAGLTWRGGMVNRVMTPVSSTEHEHAHHGHGEHPSQPAPGGPEHHHAEEFHRRFWISLALAVPVIAFSPMIRDWLSVL